MSEVSGNDRSVRPIAAADRNRRRRRMIHSAVIAVVSAVVALSVVGCGESQAKSMHVGDCGYFEKAGRGSELQRRDCTDPEAVLIVVRASAAAECPDYAYTWSPPSQMKSKPQNVCTHVNAHVGDCVNDPGNKYAHLDRLRKVPCSTPGAYQVNTRIEKHDFGVCAAVSTRYRDTASITHEQPPVSFCLHRV
ncbi:LppU/SCO3897 family protein [Nocardia callitridis]